MGLVRSMGRCRRDRSLGADRAHTRSDRRAESAGTTLVRHARCLYDRNRFSVLDRGDFMRNALLRLAGLALFTMPVSAQSVDDMVARYIKTVGGMEAIQAVHTLRRAGKFTGDGGFEAAVVQENKRPNKVRREFSLQGMTAITAYDGTTGWKIEPWQGKKIGRALSEDEMKQMVEDADFDEPLVNYRQKGHKVEFLGMEQVEGTDVFKLKVTLASGDVRYYYLDTDYYVP